MRHFYYLNGKKNNNRMNNIQTYTFTHSLNKHGVMKTWNMILLICLICSSFSTFGPKKIQNPSLYFYFWRGIWKFRWCSMLPFLLLLLASSSKSDNVGLVTSVWIENYINVVTASLICFCFFFHSRCHHLVPKTSSSYFHWRCKTIF